MKHIALLRGINVGTAKRIAMADLRAVVESVGYGDVQTVLNSGNVIYSARGSARTSAARIERALPLGTGVSARVAGITAAERSQAIAGNPLEVTDPSRFLVLFFVDPADIKRALPVAREDWMPERIAVGARAVYLWHP